MVHSASDETQPVVPEEIPVIPTRAAWSPTAIVWMCILLSVLTGGIMYALNFERLGQPQKKKLALAGIIVLCGGFYGVNLLVVFKPELLPSINDGHLRAFSMISSFILMWYFYLTQQPLFVRHIKQGGKKASLLPPILWSLGTIVILGVILLACAFWYGSQDEQEFAQAISLMEKEKYDEAEAILKTYRTKYPEEPLTYYNLAIIYSVKGQFSQAKQQLKESLRLNPDNKDAKALLKQVEEDLRMEKLQTE